MVFYGIYANFEYFCRHALRIVDDRMFRSFCHEWQVPDIQIKTPPGRHGVSMAQMVLVQKFP